MYFVIERKICLCNKEYEEDNSCKEIRQFTFSNTFIQHSTCQVSEHSKLVLCTFKPTLGVVNAIQTFYTFQLGAFH